MAISTTQNVKLGVCRARYNGIDLGLTKGGVEVSVTTDTHKVNVDQAGQTAVAELIMGRNCVAKLPLAETTLDNLVATMPGATLKTTGGAQAIGNIVIAATPANNNTVVVNGVTFTFKTTPTGVTDLAIGANAAASAANLLRALQASTNSAVAVASFAINASNSSRIDVTYKNRGTAGNSFSLVGTATNILVAGGSTAATAATSVNLTGGVAAAAERVDVTTAVSTNLLTIAKELVLHPMANADNDYSEDFVIPLAGTAGKLSFAYKVDDERVYDIEFTAYPDSTKNDRLFYIGDSAAT